MVTPRLGSIQEAADYSRLATHTIRQWAREGRFTTFKVGSRVLVDLDDLERFIVSHQRRRREEVVGVANE
jgi:excisionase family DNA binding protein